MGFKGALFLMPLLMGSTLCGFQDQLKLMAQQHLQQMASSSPSTSSNVSPNLMSHPVQGNPLLSPQSGSRPFPLMNPSSPSLPMSLFSQTFPATRRFEGGKLMGHLERIVRQLPSLWQAFAPANRNQALSRQLFDMIDIVQDVAMLTMIGIPILGLVAMGATALQPLFAPGRKKRSSNSFPLDGVPTSGFGGMVQKAGKSFLYARNLYDVISQLEETFDKYDIKSNDCQLRAICEAHRVGPNSDYKGLGDKLIDLIKLEKEVEAYETIPLGKMFFQLYADAANFGKDLKECNMLYPNCPKETITSVREKEKKDKEMKEMKDEKEKMEKKSRKSLFG